jgi:tetratricopeptide (TPR) repeat protein
MRYQRKRAVYVLVNLLVIVSFSLVCSLAMAQPRPMTEDIYTPLARGYGLMADGKYELAKKEFEKVIQSDPDNPYANNNLAAIAEREGKLKQALGYLNAAAAKADQYPYKISKQVCFPAGLCTAIKPEREYTTTTGTSIAAVIGDNISKLQKKMETKGK